MIARLRGQLVAVDTAGLVVDVGGVGYRVLVPAGAFPQRIGDQIVVHTHLAVREDALTLFGFADVAALRLFERLLAVNGIGPKLALAALATLGAAGVRDAILAEDTKALVTVPGLGRKTAQRLILELGGNLVSEQHDADAAVAPPGDDPRAEVRLALSALGYEPSEITRAIGALGDAEDADAEALLRQALRMLAGSP
ncbi:MAG: Holliday junction branch migration protein RuvA [Actinobacteria bacterium]|nr:Holliday junction branch migration protein RuvA [Actinomycetota bacterium]